MNPLRAGLELDEGQYPLVDRPIAVSAAFEGSEEIAEAREMARDELVTNARKYAPGPCLLALEISDGAVRISVWDSSTAQPSVQAADPVRVGQHGLEILMAVSQSFCIHREPVGKRISVTLVLADDPGGDAAGRQAM
ncbi:ATP-binding protein [Streptomyces africanus]|uniref:ATP-binding protein n=1 Tax=Streptomyces africanus TaxID=231024 RepID=UPI000A37C01B|nr:ATP-binding protein [Streptomyces africanus]